MFKESDLILEARHVTKEFTTTKGRRLTACNDVSLRAYKGKTLGIVGESGCGKSTLVRMLVQLEQPTKGEIYYRGQNILEFHAKEKRENRRHIQMVFQDPLASFHPKMKVIDILTEPLFNFGLLEKKRKRKRQKNCSEW